MVNANWKTLRISLLAITFAGVALFTGKFILYPPADKHTVTKFQFPESVPLPEWQQVKSKPIDISNNSGVNAARQYSYQKNSIFLEIEMRYLVDTIAEVQGMVKAHNVLKSYPGKLTIANAQGVGFYGVLQHQNRAYLTACINPRGGSTVTSEQFRYNRNTYDVNFTRIVPWLLGQIKLQDRRCLWAQMSISLDRTTPTDANKILEKTWISWHQWWQQNFPKP
ncbi:cyanoexosortase A system-associated protein [Oscillatoriales cyanobacterium USR001]|nr:cyanoexosortase A system-associated protein [Oscillatoriales cyanobacterium USR001]